MIVEASYLEVYQTFARNDRAFHTKCRIPQDLRLRAAFWGPLRKMPGSVRQDDPLSRADGLGPKALGQSLRVLLIMRLPSLASQHPPA